MLTLIQQEQAARKKEEHTLSMLDCGILNGARAKASHPTTAHQQHHPPKKNIVFDKINLIKA